MLQRICRIFKRLTFIVCRKSRSSPALTTRSRRQHVLAARKRFHLGSLSGCLVCLLLFPLSVIYLNGIPAPTAEEGEMASAPSKPTISNRSRMFANPILRAEDRRMIVLAADSGVDDLEPLETLLSAHSRTLYLGDVNSFPSLQTLSLLGGDRSRLLPGLADCSKNSLAHLVDYANDHLLDAGEAPWCSLRLRRSHRDTDNSRDVYCRPATKLRFVRLCRSNHIGVRLDNRTAMSEFVPHAETSAQKVCCYRIVRILNSSASIDSGSKNNSWQGPDIDSEGSTQRVYPRDWFKTGNVAEKVVELFNFLDLYLDDRTLQWLEFLGHKLNFPTMPPHTKGPPSRKTNRTQPRVRLRGQSLPIEVM